MRKLIGVIALMFCGNVFAIDCDADLSVTQKSICSDKTLLILDWLADDYHVKHNKDISLHKNSLAAACGANSFCIQDYYNKFLNTYMYKDTVIASMGFLGFKLTHHSITNDGIYASNTFSMGNHKVLIVYECAHKFNLECRFKEVLSAT